MPVWSRAGCDVDWGHEFHALGEGMKQCSKEFGIEPQDRAKEGGNTC
jgi:hypothetical protein